MHWLDSTILAVLAAAAVLGAYSGLLMQVFRLAGFAVALYAANCLNGGATVWLQESLMRGTEARTCGLVAYGVSFFAVYLAIFCFTLVLERGVRAARLQHINRLLGAMLAVVKMGLLIGAIAYVAQQVGYQATNQVLEQSALAPLLARGVERAVTAVPAEYRSDWANSWNHFREGLPAKDGKGESVEPVR